MSLRPRFAGDGRLRLPMTIGFVAEASGTWSPGDIVGELGGADYDPFARVASGLLLAEEFARVDLSDGQAAVNWHAQYGVVDLEHFLGGPLGSPTVTTAPVSAGGRFRDSADDVRFEQANVAWHLAALARLSDPLPGDRQTPMDRPAGWDERWAQPVLRVGVDLVWLGGGNEYERHISWGMTERPEPNGLIPSQMSLAEYADWWRQAHAAYQTIVRERVPFVTVHDSSGTRIWDRDEVFGGQAATLTDGLTAGWWGLAELQRRLIEPYVRKAGDHEVDVHWQATDAAPHDGSGPAAGDPRGPLVVRERRRWDSLLAPVYVQLLEGLRRVTEGDRAAAFCRECGQPFLTIDARRSTFCNDRERFRYTQRERRKRLAAADAAKPRP